MNYCKKVGRLFSLKKKNKKVNPNSFYRGYIFIFISCDNELYQNKIELIKMVFNKKETKHFCLFHVETNIAIFHQVLCHSLPPLLLSHILDK